MARRNSLHLPLDAAISDNGILWSGTQGVILFCVDVQPSIVIVLSSLEDWTTHHMHAKL